MLFLFSESPLRPKAVDEEFSEEAAAARTIGTVRTVSLEDMNRGVSMHEVLSRIPAVDEPTDAVYRGWMLDPAQYAVLSAELEFKGYTMLTNAARYSSSHVIVGWVEALSAFTPATVHSSNPELALLAARGAEWDAAIVRDYTKSLKHDWYTACYIPDLNSPEAETVVDTFVEKRGEFLVGGVVLREFECYVGAEVRTWWVDGELALATPHPDTPDELPAGIDVNTRDWVPDGLGNAVRGLGVRFCTVDLVRNSDGVLRVVELGDGGVSGRPSSVDAETFIEALFGKD